MHLNQSWPCADPAQAFDWQSATDCNVVRLHLRDWVWGRRPGNWWWRLRQYITSQDATYLERSRQRSLSGTEEIQKPMHRRGDIVTQERWRHDSEPLTMQPCCVEEQPEDDTRLTAASKLCCNILAWRPLLMWWALEETGFLNPDTAGSVSQVKS